MTNYRLNVHSWTTLPPSLKHTGFELEELDDNGNLLRTHTVDLNQNSGGNIIFNINTYGSVFYFTSNN